jgi:hypothetical protein
MSYTIPARPITSNLEDMMNIEIGQALTAEEIDDLEIIQEERKRERLEEDRSYRADMLDEM